MNVMQWVFIFAVIQIILLAGCATTKPLPQSFQNEFKLKVNWDENPTKTGNAVGVKGNLDGWSAVWIGGCEINQPKPTDVDDIHALLTLGRELFHCTDGDYHN